MFGLACKASSLKIMVFLDVKDCDVDLFELLAILIVES